MSRIGKKPIEILSGASISLAGRTVTVQGPTAPQNPQPGMFGSSCSTGAQCQSKLCVNDASGLFCSQACSGPANCPGGYDCLEGVCRSKVGRAERATQSSGLRPSSFSARVTVAPDIVSKWPDTKGTPCSVRVS